eukprot:9318226-Ditylum_brightwellii.AAC.1
MPAFDAVRKQVSSLSWGGEGEEWVAARLHVELHQPLRWKLRHTVVELSHLGAAILFAKKEV